MDDWELQNGIQGYAQNSDLDAQQQRELRSEQMRFYRQANAPQWEGFGGRKGVKEFLTGCLILVIIGLTFKYVFGIS